MKDKKDRDGQVEEILRSLTLEQKIGQMICVGLTTTYVDDEFKQLLGQYPFGAVGLFTRNLNNAEQVRTLTEDIQNTVAPACNGLRALIAIDQEGGVVSQFPSGITQTPGNFAIAATGSEKYAFECSRITGLEMCEMGVNMNWAPVLDLNTNPLNEVIDVRSFGDNIELVSRLGAAAIRGLHTGGVGATAKHFPGHGGATVTRDPETGLYINANDEANLFANELIPFERAVGENVDAIMFGLIAVPALEKGKIIPASVSRTMVSSILRKRFGYNGVIMVDDLDHPSLISKYTLKKVAQMTVSAGTDIMIICHSRAHQIIVFNSLLNAVKKGKIKPERVDESVRRIIGMKLDIAEYRENREAISEMEKSRLIRQACRDSIMVLRDPKKLIPVGGEKYESVLVFLPELVSLTSADRSEAIRCHLGEMLSMEFRNVRVVNVPLAATQRQTEEYAALCESFGLIVAATENVYNFPGYLKMLREVSRRKPVIIVSLRHPYEVNCLPEEATVLLAFSQIDSSMEAAVNVITGRSLPQGTLPVRRLEPPHGPGAAQSVR